MPIRFPHLGFRIAYDGKGFFGFQKQPNARTIQEEIEKALKTLLRKEFRFSFTSRTDAGVCAFDQWGMLENAYEFFQRLSEKEKYHFLISLNALLPDEVVIWRALRLREDFNPKTSPVWKEYHYRVVQGPAPDPLSRERSLWICRDLNIKAMRSALKSLEGEHDFSAFATRAKRYEGGTVRKILKAKILVQNHPFMKDLKIISFQIRGTGFLHNMVRTIVGTTIEIGSGKSESMPKVLRSKSRIDAGVNAPAHPLTLVQTQIPSKLFQPLPRIKQPD